MISCGLLAFWVLLWDGTLGSYSNPKESREEIPSNQLKNLVDIGWRRLKNKNFRSEGMRNATAGF